MLVGQGGLFDDADEEVQAIVAQLKATRDVEPACLPERKEHDDALVTVLTDQVSTEEHREGGPVHVGLAFWQRLGLDGTLEEAGLGTRTRMLACAMVLNRLVAPRSEHAMPDWMTSTALGDLLETYYAHVAEDPVCRTMDNPGPHRATHRQRRRATHPQRRHPRNAPSRNLPTAECAHPAHGAHKNLVGTPNHLIT